MTDRFHKMHGLGNDFVVIDARMRPVAMNASLVRAIADRKTGIGCDQLIVLEATPDADARMRIWNADGSEVESCGNAARAVGLLIGEAILETKGGRIAVAQGADGIDVDMGGPRFAWQEIPLAYALDTHALPLAWDTLAAPTALNVGNPHVVFFVTDAASVDIERLGPLIENDAVFPDRINVNIAQVDSRSTITLRTWERGVGLTRACGTGACATGVAAIRAGLVNSPVTVTSAGGALVIEWSPGMPIRMTGPAAHVFRGDIDWCGLAT